MIIESPEDYNSHLHRGPIELADGYSPYPKSLLGRALRSLGNWTEHLTGTGTLKIIPLHQQLLDAFLSALEPDMRLLLEQQLAQPFFMQFWHKGRISPFFFDNFRLPKEMRLPLPEFDDRLYKIEMFVDGRKQWAQVMFVSGRIYSISFKQPFKAYEGKDIRFGAVKFGNSKQSTAAAIDRQEHGKDGHHATGEE
jgi:hypothetical protein